MRPRLSGCLSILAFGFLTWVANLANADIELPKLFSDHMVLQQNQSMRIKGNADAEESLTVMFNGQTIDTVADKNGKWSAIIATGPAGGPYQLEIASNNSETKVVVSDVLVGEVWICGGQSNMVFPVSQSANAQRDIEVAKNFPTIRGFNVAAQASVQPLDDFVEVDSWFCCSPDSIKDFSAVAYLFGRELSRKLDVPIGLINVAADNTTLEAWTPYDSLQEEGSFEQLLAHWQERSEPTNPNRVSNSYNAMVAPLARFGFRGVIWYQGEANVGRGAQYRRMFPLMIESWRKKLGQPDCPFLFVQPTPYRYRERPVEALPELWDAQLRTLTDLSNTGMVVTTDLGDVKNNRPANKSEVARRLTLWAFAGCYAELVSQSKAVSDEKKASEQIQPAVRSESDATSDQSGEKQQTLASFDPDQSIVASGPLFESADTQAGAIVICFKMATSGLVLSETVDHGITICGEDRKFVPAQVKLEGQRLIVSHPSISKPVAARYAWHDTAQSTLKNTSGLPASPFRTDQFPLTSDGVEF